MSIREERKAVLFELYRMDLVKEFTLSAAFDTKYQKRFFKTYFLHQEEIDEKLTEVLKDWSIETLGKIDLACLRLGICEILYLEDIPSAVSINEVVNIAKEYGEENSYRFVNGILKSFV